MNANWDHGDIQGLVFSGYGKRMVVASYHLLRIADPAAAKAWLADLLPRVTRGVPDDAPKPAEEQNFCLNVAFSHDGLAKLGLTAEALETFELAFQEGMTSERRTRILADFGPSAPDQWAWGNAAHPVDVLLLLFAPDVARLATLEVGEGAKYLAHGLTQVVAPIATTPLEGASREHFGFADGISQPVPVVPDDDEKTRSDPQAVPAGEFVFGYANAYGNENLIPGREKLLIGPAKKPFGTNGSYVVFRQFEQDVSAFWNFLAARAGSRDRAEWLAAKIVGRWPSGARVRPGQTADPLSLVPDDDTFDLTDDPLGHGMPVGSHVRRSNPRGMQLADDPKTSLLVAQRHRVLRRGRNYGPRAADKYQPDGQKRGLLFMALNANIDRQFEFIMHTWVHNPVFGSLYQETDPLIGDPSRIVDPVTFQSAKETTFTVPADPFRERVHGVTRFVNVVGGAYFFLPGMDALAALAAG
ncbi:Dyp-type peroxidase [Limnoglobus roseus]|uniref:Multifunctional dye peroxidase DyP2 n=1 Tax=Limnoglobus roseus TaxID=2598579 RepID=A0A5C1A5U7_9BACT|nr:peroxidase [Limnoglobus roseus]QEL13356.1 Multifunctional dye peroxidase DyP2 [Limnoglobus roseus]